MTLPNFLIVGAAKSGTTSLYHYLKQHPEVFMPERKEPHFFVDWEGGVRTLGEYASLFSDAEGCAAVGEASTGYLYDPEAVERIKRILPQVRIIIILRSPVEMCFALWRHMRRLGKRGERLSFEAALNAEPKRMSDPQFRARCTESWHGNFYYFHRALYYAQVKRYLDAFGQALVQIHIFEDFKQDPLKTCRDVFSFLGVSKDFAPTISKYNVGAEVRHRGLQKALTHPSLFWQGLGSTIPEGFVTRIKEFLKRSNRKSPPQLEAKTRNRLVDAYTPDVEFLGRLIGKDLRFWLREG
jgi:hypothetical protein